MSSTNHRILKSIILSICFSIGIIQSAFAFFNKNEIADYWQTHSAVSQVEVSHVLWGEFLASYVLEKEGINLVDYAAGTDSDRDLLRRYLDLMQSVEVTGLNRAEQKSYWVNLYNALTVWVILKHYPVASILEISYGLLTRGPWSEKLIDIENQQLSLDNIEHDILRPIFEDERIHYAVNCASYSCPNLQRQPFTAGNLEKMLEQSAKDYINHPRGVRIDSGKLVVSSIYDWYGQDFGANEGEIVDHLRQYADKDLAIKLNSVSHISTFEYDWLLNVPSPN